MSFSRRGILRGRDDGPLISASWTGRPSRVCIHQSWTRRAPRPPVQQSPEAVAAHRGPDKRLGMGDILIPDQETFGRILIEEGMVGSGSRTMAIAPGGKGGVGKSSTSVERLGLMFSGTGRGPQHLDAERFPAEHRHHVRHGLQEHRHVIDGSRQTRRGHPRGPAA